jgi:uncharacterized membrane protein YqhA
MASGNRPDETKGFASRVPAYTRFVVVIPVLGLFASAVTMVILAALGVAKSVQHAIRGELGKSEAIFEFIELADAFLLATVLYIMALGLYELFIDDRLPLPEWLAFHTLDDLKEKLLGVVIVVLGVQFLGAVMGASTPESIMYRGLGIAAVIAALAFFLSKKGTH